MRSAYHQPDGLALPPGLIGRTACNTPAGSAFRTAQRPASAPPRAAAEAARAVIGHGCRVPASAKIGSGVVVNDGAYIGDGAVLGDGVCVGAGSVVASGAMVPAKTRIPDRTVWHSPRCFYSV